MGSLLKFPWSLWHGRGFVLQSLLWQSMIVILIVNLRRSRTTWETRLWVFWGRGYVDEINCGWHHLGGLDPKLKRRKQAIIIPFFLAENTLWTATPSSRLEHFLTMMNCEAKDKKSFSLKSRSGWANWQCRKPSDVSGGRSIFSEKSLCFSIVSQILYWILWTSKAELNMVSAFKDFQVGREEETDMGGEDGTKACSS